MLKYFFNYQILLSLLLVFCFWPKASSAPANALIDFGQFFFVDQYFIRKETWIETALDKGNVAPAGFIYWNFTKSNKNQLFDLTSHYDKLACQNRRLPLLQTTDYEGGAYRTLNSGRRPKGIQHFRDGFTKLPHPRLLGSIYDQDRSKDKVSSQNLAFNLGKMIAIDLAEGGLRSPLTICADLARNQMWYRGIHSDPKIASKLLTHVFVGFRENSDGHFFTKHFPGLGAVPQNTHKKAIIESSPLTMEQFQEGLVPFKALINLDKKRQTSRLGIMIAHAKYDLIDAHKTASQSPKIIEGILREQLGFDGLVVSDAMWMGLFYKMHLGKTPRSMKPMRAYFESFLAGIDILMIKSGTDGTYFKAAHKYFQKAFENRLEPIEKKALSASIGKSWKEIHEKFVKRIYESSRRIYKARSSWSYVSSCEFKDTPVFSKGEDTRKELIESLNIATSSTDWGNKL